MSEQPAAPLQATTVTPDEHQVLVDYQSFLTRYSLQRTLLCKTCGHKAEAGTGQTGWACQCRLLVWRLM